jgi:hypothetical protein
MKNRRFFHRVSGTLAGLGLLLATPVFGAVIEVEDSEGLAAALQTAAANGEGDTIVVAAGTYGVATVPLTYTAAVGENFPLTVSGAGPEESIFDFSGMPGPAGIIIDTTGLASDDGAAVMVSGLSFRGFWTSGGSPLRIVAGANVVAVTDCSFLANRVAENGGGLRIESFGGGITLERCVFTGNRADLYGGGAFLYNVRGSVAIRSCSFDGNQALIGGGVCNGSARVVVTGSTFRGNSGAGGGLYLSNYPRDPPAVVADNVFSGNVGSGFAAVLWELSCTGNLIENNLGCGGGGAYLGVWNLVFSGNTVTGNASECPELGGGGIYYETYGGSAAIGDNRFEGNSSRSDGGGFFAKTWEGGISLRNNIINRNTSGGRGGGGAVLSGYGPPLVVDGNTFAANRAVFGGGLVVDGGGAAGMTLTNNAFAGNSALAGGGGQLSILEGSLVFAGNTLTGNRATLGNGGGIQMETLSGPYYGGPVEYTLADNIAWGNESAGMGADIYVNDYTLLGYGRPVTFVRNDCGDFTSTCANAPDTCRPAITRRGNLSRAPLFRNVAGDDPTGWNLRLKPGSPCIDAGSRAAATATPLDHDGVPRALDGGRGRGRRADLGAWERYRELHLVRPRDGELLPAGSEFTIRWVSPPAARRFTILASFDDGMTWDEVARDAEGNSLPWRVPAPRGNRTSCRLKVIGYRKNGKIFGSTIGAGTFGLEVVRADYPRGGDTFYQTWGTPLFWLTNATADVVAAVDLFSTVDGGETWSPVTRLAGNPGHYQWLTLPVLDQPSELGQVKVVLRDAAEGVLGEAVTNGYFTINNW